MSKFKKLNKKEKVEHIWEYYRFHIIGGGLGLILLSSLLIQVFGPRPPEALVNVVIMGKYDHNDEAIESFKEEIADIIQNDEGKKVEVSISGVDWESASPMETAMNQKLVLLFQAREVDVMIVEEPKFDSFVDNFEERLFVALDQEVELEEVLKNNSDNLVKRLLPEDAKEQVYGISSKGNLKLQGIGLGEDYVISVLDLSEKKEDALKTVKWLCQ